MWIQLSKQSSQSHHATTKFHSKTRSVLVKTFNPIFFWAADFSDHITSWLGASQRGHKHHLLNTHLLLCFFIYYIFSKNKFISPHHNKLLLLNMIAADDGRNASKWIMLFMMIISLSLLRFCWAISHHQQCSPLQCNSHLSESHRDLQKRTLLLCKWHVCSW